MSQPELKAILRILNKFWLVLKWAIILAIAAGICFFLWQRIAAINHVSDILER